MALSLRRDVSSVFGRALRRALPDLSAEQVSSIAVAKVCDSRQARGHYQCDAALRLRDRGESTRAVADRIVGELRDPMFEHADVGGPGFISVTFDNHFLAERLRNFRLDPVRRLSGADRKRIIVDMSSPNVAKRMHVGHLRSTVIGEAIAQLLIAQGHDVVKVNHVGDFGTQFGLILAMLRKKNVDVNTLDIDQVEEVYREAKRLAEQSKEFAADAHRCVVALQKGDPEATMVWTAVKDVSRAEYNRLYERLGIHNLIERGESSYQSLLPETVRDLVDLGIARETDGAICIFEPSSSESDEDGFPLIIRKSDGGFTYDTTDLAAIRYRFTEERADHVIYLTDKGQSEHFRKVFEAARRAQWVPPDAVCEFIGFGIMLGEDGKRFRTRDGGAVRLDYLLDQAVKRARHVIEGRDELIPNLDVDETAVAVGVSAVRYADLSRQRESDMVFSLEAMLDLKGNTSVYLQYALCRINSILRQCAGRCEFKDFDGLSIATDEERDVAVHVLRYDDVLDDASKSLQPHLLCHWAFSLASALNFMYQRCPVVGDPRMKPRSQLLFLAGTTLRHAFNVLGINALERM
ncbi:arginine--tRNA ligase [Plasmodiophora brassicae]